MSTTQLHTLEFSNMFSYADDNVLQLDKSEVTQLDAVNGSGKTSLALIIQELLYGKNVKGIKKGDILNRYLDTKTWTGSITFTTDDVLYEVQTKRTGASTKVKLLQNGEDISEHKVVDTYKKIQSIIGLSFEIFSQLSYQSSKNLLNFLQATDTNRKKFLISLFNLEEYMTIGEKIKAKASEVDSELVKLKANLATIENFLETTTIPDKKEELPTITLDTSLSTRIAEITKELSNVNDTCKRIDRNNILIKERDSLSFDQGIKKPKPFEFVEEYQALKLDLTMLKNEIAKLERERDAVKVIKTCPSCGQPVDSSHSERMKATLESQISSKKEQYELGIVKAIAWSDEVKQYENERKRYTDNKTKLDRFEQLLQLIDETIPAEYPDTNQLESEKRTLQKQLQEQQKKIDEVTQHNKNVSAHNAKVDALVEQQDKFLVRQVEVKEAILVKSSKASHLAVLKKAFSPAGMVAFKLEALTKELENTINRYLAELSDGQFQLEFKLEKEKLNINIISNGVSAPSETVSEGEFSRIQTSVLLAIRALLSKLGGSSLNLLFLDEITGVLDSDGKERLVEVLSKEDGLNVFLISHDFSHPLVEKIAIAKKDDISCIAG